MLGIVIFITDKQENEYRRCEEYRSTKKIYYAEAFIVSFLTSLTSWIGVIILSASIVKNWRKK